MPPATPIRPRVVILTASIAAITATGAWYGAGLKTQQEYKQVSSPFPIRDFLCASPLISCFQERKARIEATPEEKMARLEDAKAGLMSKRIGLVRKIEQLHERKNAQAGAGAGNDGGGAGKG
ncbi:MAG: hypothetical protein M1819_004189 [Sarea resinae]|nr:MAG: hypothetical protein M1819_004189 [Sarea resinae]